MVNLKKFLVIIHVEFIMNYNEPYLKLGSIWEHAPSSKSCNYVQFQGQIPTLLPIAI